MKRLIVHGSCALWPDFKYWFLAQEATTRTQNIPYVESSWTWASQSFAASDSVGMKLYQEKMQDPTVRCRSNWRAEQGCKLGGHNTLCGAISGAEWSLHSNQKMRYAGGMSLEIATTGMRWFEGIFGRFEKRARGFVCYLFIEARYRLVAFDEPTNRLEMRKSVLTGWKVFCRIPMQAQLLLFATDALSWHYAAEWIWSVRPAGFDGGGEGYLGRGITVHGLSQRRTALKQREVTRAHRPTDNPKRVGMWLQILNGRQSSQSKYARLASSYEEYLPYAFIKKRNDERMKYSYQSCWAFGYHEAVIEF